MKTPETYPLLYPIQHGDKQITELTLRRPKAKDMVLLEAAQARGAGGSTITLVMIGAMNDLPPEVTDEIDAEDLIELSEKIVGFLPEKITKAAPAQ